MKRWIESTLLVLAISMAFTTLTSSRVAAMDKPHVQDDAKFFSAETVKTADELISKIKSTYKRDVYVETWQSVPDDQQAKLKEMGEDEYFGDAVFRRASAVKMSDGIIIVICRNPSYLRIGVGAELKQLEFVTTDRDKLRKLMLDKFRGKKFDEGLLDGLNLIEATLKEGPDRQAARKREKAAERAADAASGRPANAAGTAKPGAMAPASTEPYDPSHPVPDMPGPDRSHLFSGRNLVLVGIGIFVLYLLMRALMGGARRSQQPMGYGPAGGMGGGMGGMGGGNYPQGGGFGGGSGAGRGFLGGLLGGVLGGAAYDRFSRGSGGETGNIGSHSETYIPPQMNTGGSSSDAPSGRDAFDLPRDSGGDTGGFESSGGNFGDGAGDSGPSSDAGSSAGGGFDSSGGSFDSGGGDSGGGDFSGGGGDAGGGGDF